MGGDSPSLPVTVEGDHRAYFRHHSTQVSGTLPWVAASGVTGIKSLSVTPHLVPPPVPKEGGGKKEEEDDGDLGGNTAEAAAPDGSEKEPSKPSHYTLRFYFSEPENIQPGERVFSISVQGKVVIENLDIVKEAGGPRRALVKEVAAVQIRSASNRFRLLLDSSIRL